MKILLVEDNLGDARLLEEYLADASEYSDTLDHATTLAQGVQKLKSGRFDLLLLDLSLPDSHGINTVIIAREAAPDLPIVVLSGLDDEAVAIEAVRIGAQDYLVKGQTLAPLLMRAMRYAVERQRLTRELQEALTDVKRLSGLLPICASCKKIRDDTGYWTQVEQYIEERSEASFTHGLCPECVSRIFPDYADEPKNAAS